MVKPIGGARVVRNTKPIVVRPAPKPQGVNSLLKNLRGTSRSR